MNFIPSPSMAVQCALLVLAILYLVYQVLPMLGATGVKVKTAIVG